MKPNAAMNTAAPVAPRPYWYMGEMRTQTGRRPTSLMVHLEGHGPRRIYRSDFNGRYFYILKRRRVFVELANIFDLLTVR